MLDLLASQRQQRGRQPILAVTEVGDDEHTEPPLRHTEEPGVEAAPLDRGRAEVGEARFTGGKFAEARALFEKLSTEPTFEEFLTVPAYAAVVASGA